MAIQAVERPPVTSWRQILGIAGRGVLFLLLLMVASAGIVAGCMAWIVTWMAAAFVEGYRVVMPKDAA